MEITIQTEIDLIQLSKPERKCSDMLHGEDTIHSNLPEPPFHPTKVAHLIQRLDFIQQDNNNDLTNTDHWQIQFSKILLARIYYESGQYTLALEQLQNLALKMEDVQQGYGLVLLVEARTIKGMCFEWLDDLPSALASYHAAWLAVESQPQERSIMLSFWVEQCLYRACLLKLRSNCAVSDTLESMRAYVQLASSHWSPHWRMIKRWVVFKHYANYLVQTHKNNSFVPSTSAATVYEELSILMNLYRHLFTTLSPFLKPVAQGEYGLALAKMIMEGHDITGWGETNHIRRVLQFLYGVKNATFNHATVNRYIFLTLLRLGSLEEAKHALRAYLDLMGVPDFDTDFVLDDAMDETFNPHQKDHVTDQTPHITTVSKATHILQRLSPHEPLDAVIHVLLAGIQLYGDEEQNGVLAAYLSDLALDLLLMRSESSSDTKLDEVYRARGSSYGLIAAQSVDPESRAKHHEKALESFSKAVKMGPLCWKNHYCRGLQQAVVRDTHAAIQSLTRSIELYPRHVDGWHVLALLYSCRRTNDLNKARKTLEAGVLQSTLTSMSAQGIPVYSWTGEVNANELYEQAASYLSIRISLLALGEATHGPEHVLDAYEGLFGNYTQLTQQLGISFKEEEEEESVVVEKQKRSSPLIRRTSSSTQSTTSTVQNRRRSSSVESRVKKDSDSVLSRRPSQQQQGPVLMHRSNSTLDSSEIKKRQIQLIDLGLAKRIGSSTTASSLSRKGSERSLVTNASAVSLASLLKPSYSMGSLRSSSISSSFSNSSKGGTNAMKKGPVFSHLHHHQAFENRQKTKWQSQLVKLWIMSTETFMKAGLFEEAYKALSEAEELGLGDPGVWYQLGRLSLKAKALLKKGKATEELKRVAKDAFEKALVLDQHHVPSQIAKAKMYMVEGEYGLADGLFQEITRGFGWDDAEAWFEYGQLMKMKGQLLDAKSCFLFALDLHDTQAVRNLKSFKTFVY
ncbi:hypothetical protein INT47_007992 [Mucor saturninus]|uniref:TPR-like protein n=1 Tax=Mucor saturninus TaxID=64648 RepID=A0A8H7R9N0_9FUNG|nr:hypothetical protein INT47_007992 [Mucor saturninus]